ncbi:hypothetical protein ACFQ3S_07290 [Mucilaginibacter terrae]
MSYLLLLTNDPIRAFSYFFYTIIGIVSTLVFTLFPNKTSLFPIMGAINMISLVNIVVQSFLIRNTHLSTPYIIFTFTTAIIVGFKMMMPYLAHTLYLPIAEIGKYTSVTDLISSGVMLYLVIKIYMLSKYEAKVG